ncbi:hypothetical protein LINGRAHAP2_LOCUS27755 [Linum grandiflorum]
MSNLATELGWVGNGEGANLEKLLNRMIDESNPRLPLGYIKLDEMTSRAKIDCPPLKSLMSNLHTMGYAASKTHIVSNAIKTDYLMPDFIKLAKENMGVPQS